MMLLQFERPSCRHLHVRFTKIEGQNAANFVSWEERIAGSDVSERRCRRSTEEWCENSIRTKRSRIATKAVAQCGRAIPTGISSGRCSTAIYGTASAGSHGQEAEADQPDKKLIQYISVEIESMAELLTGHSVYTR